ncbi:arsenosugar biosynthesis radical SAM (seleno)protein ArsS [Thioalkalivibrio sp. HK1]|uniref:arsenosugar biosynthesis radical SAM (seleno)protein ArsS n=1 Tax=Thioalkalivibrio sp. HK1 TaxID=1469245 RepID=UPI000471C163|nr:arsenosugar biosynthesis radical SAM (seleno)protein ArsS [Thioalkalivibrio sp. HK1]
MHDPLPRLSGGSFPSIRRGPLSILQVNVGYRCNQTCVHCHVNAGPNRKEEMSAQTASDIVEFMQTSDVQTLDITGGAPELNPNFRFLVRKAKERGMKVIDRCNLTILFEPGQEDLADFLAKQRVSVVASLPCYLDENVDAQRGKGVYERSIEGLRRLNALGYGGDDPDLTLDLVYNPQGPVLPPAQTALEEDYKRELGNRFGIRFNRLLTLANMPVGRFASILISKGEFDDYLQVLQEAHLDANVEHVMCRNTVSIDWQGYAYDCDFNQMLDLAMRWNGKPKTHITELVPDAFEGQPIAVRDHCFGCTAGQGSGCGGALN